jgi:hypothetical protein
MENDEGNHAGPRPTEADMTKITQTTNNVVVKRKKGEKPKISEEAACRIKNFVSRVAQLQRQYGIEISAQDDAIVFRDRFRKDKWEGYGQWDAWIYNAAGEFRMRVKNVSIEDFEGWGK